MDEDGNLKDNASDTSSKKLPKRVYDSLFKLPAKFRFTEKRNEIVKFLTREGREHKKKSFCGFKGKTNNYIYKKLQNYISAVLLGLTMLAMILLYCAQYFDLYWGGQYYLVRSSITLIENDDGVSTSYSAVLYFLYKYDSSDALIPVNADEADLFYNDEQVASICGSTDKVNFFATYDTADQLKTNLNSAYMHFSTLVCLLMMIGFASYNCFYITLFLKEHHIPLIFRSANISFAYDVMRSKILFFFIFLTLCGIQA